jgi:hypothetical protein
MCAPLHVIPAAELQLHENMLAFLPQQFVAQPQSAAPSNAS